MLALTERDVNLLQLIGRCGAIKTEQARQIYGNKSWYHYKRLQVLERHGYVIRKGRYIELTRKGVGVIGEPCRYDIRNGYVRSIKAIVADVCLALEDWLYVPGREIKRRRESFNPNMIFQGLLIREGKRYVLYVVTDIPKDATIKRMQTEIRALKLDPGISANGVIAFCLDKEAMEVLSWENFGVKEFLVLPYPYGVKVVSNYSARGKNLIEQMFPNFSPSSRPFADYEGDKTYVSVLITNDMEKRRALASYIRHNMPLEKSRVIIVCLETQKAMFANKYPEIEIKTVPDELFIT